MARLIPLDMEVPHGVETESFRIRHITIDDAVKDYDAVMTSVDYLRGRLFSSPGWPSHDLTLIQDNWLPVPDSPPYHMARYLQSAFKHGLTQGDIQWAIDHPVGYAAITTRRGESGIRYVGPTSQGLAAVIAEWRGGELVVYHAHVISDRTARRSLRW